MAKQFVFFNSQRCENSKWCNG